MTFIEYLRDQLEFEDEIDQDEIFDFLLYEVKWMGLPQVPVEDIWFDKDDEEHPVKYDEPLDFENFTVLSIDPQKGDMSVIAGGDWQDPVEFKVTWNDANCTFKVDQDSIQKCTNMREGLPYEEVTHRILEQIREAG